MGISQNLWASQIRGIKSGLCRRVWTVLADLSVELPLC